MNALATAQPNITGIEAVRGDGAWIEASDGGRYLDLAAGIATCNVGHSHPAVIDAVLRQIQSLVHLGGVCGHAPQRLLAERLAEITPGRIEQFVFPTTGSEANEVALRLARAATGRAGIVAFRGSFHGRTQGALAATTSKAAFRHGVTAGDVHVAPFPRPDELGVGDDQAANLALRELDMLHRHQLAPTETACYIIEPVQGHGGCHPAGRLFLEGLRERADHHGALLTFDEIQTGFGRTGDWFAAGTYGVEPDVMTMAKALGGGFPLSAVGARADVMAALRPGDHGSTFGGNPVSCAAARAGIDAMEAEALAQRAGRLGDVALSRLRRLSASHPELRVRGLGLMIGIEVVARGTGTPVEGRDAAARALVADLVLRLPHADTNCMPVMESALIARVRDYLFENGPALPHEVATACDVPVSMVTRLVREGTLEEVRPAEASSCDSCNTRGIMGSLCPACRRKFTPPPSDEPSPRRHAENATTAPRKERPRFHLWRT